MAKKVTGKKEIKILIAVVALLIVAAALVAVILNHESKKENKEKAEIQAADGAGYDYEKDGYLKLATYKDVVVDVTPSEDDLQYAIDEFCEKNGSTKNVVLKKGDTITVDYSSTVDGKAFEDGADEDAVLTLGDYEYMEDFENGLIGKQVGTTVTVPVHFDDDYDELLKGKTGMFTIKIKSIKAEFTDETVKRATKGKYTTAAAYKEKLKADVMKENEEAKLDTAWEQIKEGTKLKEIPSAVYELAEADTNLMYEQFAEIQGLTVTELLEQLGMSEEDVPEMANDMAKERMIAKTIAFREGITMDDAYYKKGLTEAVGEENDAQMSIKELEDLYKKNQSSRPKDDILIGKVKEYVAQSVKVTK